MMNVQYEVFGKKAGNVVLIVPTVRRAINTARKLGDDYLMRRMKPMHPDDLGRHTDHEAWQRSGFWQPTDLAAYLGGKPLYWS